MRTFISTKSLKETGLQQTGPIYDSGLSGNNRLKLTYRPGQVILLGSRPSMGRTLFLLHMFSNFWGKHKMPQAFFSNEEPESLVYQKLVANVTGNKIGEMAATPADHTNPKQDILCSAKNFFLTDFLAWETLKEICANLHDNKGISVFYIDRIHGLYSKEKFESRNNELGFIIEDMKKFAMKRQILFFVSASLNREVEHREGKRPCLADLRDTGTLEESADVVMFIYRPEVYGMTEDDSGNSLIGRTEVIVAKNRNGTTGDMIFSFNNSIPRFEEYEPPVSPETDEAQKTMEENMGIPF
jgi:replicative DNA helicase